MGRMIYAAVCYLAFLGFFLWLLVWFNDLGGPITIDSGPTSSTATALAIDLPLLALFGVQHSVMARPAFKQAWTKIVPQAAERATYVLASTAVLGAVCALWHPLPDVLWDVGTGGARVAVWALQAVGWGILLSATFMIDHFHLFGLRQAWTAMRERAAADPTFRRVLLYKIVRHPIMLGFLVAFWAAPKMTVGHLVFSLVNTIYIFIGVHYEERDLVRVLGDDYEQYRKDVRKFVPLPRR